MSVLEDVPRIEEPQIQSTRSLRYLIVRTLVGIILLFAASMKGYELHTAPVMEASLLTTRWFLIVVVEFELALGFCLLAGVLPKIIWSISLLCFTLFTFITAYKAWMGEADCGCFGRAHLDPRVTLIIDLAVVIALMVARPMRGLVIPHHVKRLYITATLLLLLGIPCGWLMASAKSANVTDDGLVTAGNFVVLEPEKWVGKSCPILSHIEIGQQLKAGKWIAILYSHSCSHCIDAMPKYLQVARNLSDQGSDTKMALIQIPPIGEVASLHISLPPSVILGQLESSREWFAETPVELQLENGKVMHVATKAGGLAWMETFRSAKSD